MSADLPKVKQEFEADTHGYSANLREAARDADRFGDKNSKAALAARRMGAAAKDAADKAARAMSAAGEAAEKLAMGEINADEAAQAEAKALRELERSALKAAEAEKATARAADEAAQQYRQAARDAELAAAAERLGALKASGSIKQHNSELRKLESRFGDLSKEGEGAFQMIETSASNAFASVGSSGPGQIALVVAALGAVPFAALGAESAITLGVGGALAGLGLAATKGDKQVQTALHNMTAHIKSETKQISAPFKQTWVEIAKAGTEAFDSLAPELQKDFAVLAPVISDFAHDAAVAGGKLAPAFDASTRASDKLLHALGDRLPDIAGNVGHSIEIMANSAGQHAQEFANLVTNVSALLPVLAHVIDYATQFGSVVNPVFDVLTHGELSVNALHDGLVKLSGGVISSNHSFQVAEQTFPTFAEQAALARIETQHIASVMDIASLSAQQMGAQFDSLAGKVLTDREAMYAYRKSVTDLSDALKANGHAHGFNSQKGAENEHALDKVAVAAQKAAQGMKDDGKSAQQVSHYLEGARRTLIAAAEKMGYTSAEARTLADKLLGVTHAANTIPKSKKTKVTADTGWAMSNLDRFLAKVRQIPTHRQLTVDVRYNGKRPDLAATGGEYMGAGKGFKYGAGGEVSGLISGPGTGTSDSIPAPWLSNGEFVVNSQTTADNTAALMNLNAGMSWMRAGLLGGEKFAKGGKVGIGKLEQKQIAKLHAAQARVNLARSRPEYLAAMAAQHALESMRKSVYGGFSRGGLGGPGSAHETVVQHVTQIDVHVAGSVWQTTQLAQELQSVILRNGMSLTLPPGR